MARKIQIEFIGKDSTGRSVASVENRYSKLGNKMKQVGRMAGLGLAAGLALTARAAVDAGKAAAEDEAAQSRLAQTLKTATGATKGQIDANEQYITAMGKVLGVADDELRPALGRLAVATGSIDKAQNLAAIAMDVSAGSGKSLEAVSTALAKAQGGNVGALGRLGIATKDADGKTKSLAEITQDLTNKYQGAAATAADTTAGKQKKLSVAYGELKEKIGAQLLPVMEKLTEVGMKVVAWVEKNPGAVKVFAIAVGALAVAFAAAFVAANWIPIAIAAVITVLVLAYKKVDWFRQMVDVAFALISGYVRANAKVFTWLYNGVIQPVVKLILGAIGHLMVGFGKMLQGLSKVPGFGWAKKAGDAMEAAGKKALGLRDNIKKIPTKHSTKISTPGMDRALSQAHSLARLLKGIDNSKITKTSVPGQFDPDAYATGTNFASGGLSLVGEEGPELVSLRRGAQVIPNHKLGVSAGGGGTVSATINLVVDGKVLAQSLVKFQRDSGRPIFA